MKPRAPSRTPPLVAVAVAVAVVVAAAACVGPGAFPCHEDQQCRAAGSADGFCESTGSCSFLDDHCQPSGRRYGAHAAAALADTCVEDACPANPVTDVRAGAAHACVVRGSGQVACWGAGTDGQLGDGTTISRSTIAPVPGLAAARAVALGERHTCALLVADGSVWCWGANEAGQLGDGTDQPRSAPVQVEGLAGVTGLAAGAAFTCALEADGAVVCWGRNADGELGLGAASDPMPTPQLVSTLPGAATLAARDRHACALTGDDGRIFCWGSNNQGELGIGSQDPSPAPTELTAIAGRATALAAGAAHTCAVDDSGQLWCWGTNQLGEIGDGSDQLRLSPRLVSLPMPVTALAAGAHHTCARENDGTVWCWGANQAGQLGEGTTTNIDVPVPATGIGDAVDVTAGDSFSCAHKRDGSVWCWGDDRLGQLGTGAAIERLSPVRVSNLSGVLSLTAAGSHTCARRPASGGAAATVCWGDNQAGEIGDGTRIDRATPVALKIALDARDVAAGALHTCLRGGDGSVWCWGRGSSGQLGAAALIDSVVPASVPGLTGVTAIATGGAHTCALQDTTAVCWGANDQGQLGDGTTSASMTTTATGRSTPAVVPGAGDVVDLALGGAHTCALRTDGTVACWGRGDEGQLGDRNQTSSATPVMVANLASGSGPLLTGVVGLTAGDQHTCAVLADGTAACWGAGGKGQLGWGSAQPRPLPAAVMHLEGAVEIVAGANHSCARVSPDGKRETPGSVTCWGDNSGGQLGNGTRMSWPVPAPTVVVDNAIALAAGDAHTCALLSDRSVVCWGSDAAGQLGDSAALQSPTAQPTRIACP